MTINVTNPDADRLTRKFASIEGVSISEAIVIAMREAIERRLKAETPEETAARIRARHGVELSAKSREPLPRSAFDDMWGDN